MVTVSATIEGTGKTYGVALDNIRKAVEEYKKRQPKMPFVKPLFGMVFGKGFSIDVNIQEGAADTLEVGEQPTTSKGTPRKKKAKD